MLTVCVFINGKPIYTRTCCNVSHKHKSKCKRSGKDAYLVDDGRMIMHRRSDPAVDLAVELLKGVMEPAE